jgi:hypothetical protein
VVELVTLPLNVPTREIQTMMMKIVARKTRGIKTTRKETMEGMTRTKTSIQRRTTTHLMMMTQTMIMNLERVLFLAMDVKEVNANHDESEEEGEVDLEAELISALEELHK